MSLGHLDAPPIIEVVCGVHFAPLVGLDPLVVGAYGATRRDEFPKHSLHPVLVEDPARLLSESPPIRTWLISADDSFVLQFQSDRFYVNWRKSRGAYPRFGDHDGGVGLLGKTLSEFERFSAFCESHFGNKPEPLRVELAKIDLFSEREHWKDFQDLSNLLPCLRPFGGFLDSGAPRLLIRLVGSREAGDLAVTIGSSVRDAGDGEKTNGISLETRATAILPDPTVLREAFVWCNENVNRVFDDLVAEPERATRFMKGVPE